jgi:hypothetical protein
MERTISILWWLPTACSQEDTHTCEKRTIGTFDEMRSRLFLGTTSSEGETPSIDSPNFNNG